MESTKSRRVWICQIPLWSGASLLASWHGSKAPPTKSGLDRCACHHSAVRVVPHGEKKCWESVPSVTMLLHGGEGPIGTYLVRSHINRRHYNVMSSVAKVLEEFLLEFIIVLQNGMLRYGSFHVFHPAICCLMSYTIIGMSSHQPCIFSFFLSTNWV